MRLLRTLVLGISLCFGLTTWADEPFRKHRYDAFEACRVESHHTVMIGNSITNMHEWWEALGGNHDIINRGVSGAVSDEMLEHLSPILAGHPTRAFVMIGTNDIGSGKSAAHVAENLRKMILRFKSESPETKLYVQSILPSHNGTRGGKIAGANDTIRTICTEEGITYIDLYPTFDDGEGHIRQGWSFDDLHPKAPGYRAWCRMLVPFFTADGDLSKYCIYSDNDPDIYEGRQDSYGARLGTLSLLPIGDEDIVLIGDEMIHSGEWHELLDTPFAKNRGTGWGYPGCDITWTQKCLPHILHGRQDNKAPRAIVLYAGAEEAEKGISVTDFEAKYRDLLHVLRRECPDAKVIVLSIAPNADRTKDETFTRPFNKALRSLVKREYNTTFVDIYAPLKAEGMMSGNYVSASGYRLIAEKIRQSLGHK